MSNNDSASGGVGFFGLLALVFIVLKLTEVIEWSWWWVLSPLWAPLAIVLVVAALGFVVYEIFGASRRRRRR